MIESLHCRSYLTFPLPQGLEQRLYWTCLKSEWYHIRQRLLPLISSTDIQ